ncbi:MAG: hypothetical protein B6D41_05120 [Chloroflexi bacterium UTCFX4]|jgi:hypothetical protein|nr:MAG: hypothetical protein B6D41_05120 [Chloroflexi bacterium UTCFX4]
MVTLTLSAEQVIQLVKQLPPKDKQTVLDALSMERNLWWDTMLEQGEKKMHQLAREGGLSWDQMDEQARLDFVDNLFHEDRDAT